MPWPTYYPGGMSQKISKTENLITPGPVLICNLRL